MLDADITKRRHLRHRDGRIRAFSGGLVEDGWSVVVPVTMKDVIRRKPKRCRG